MKITFIILGFVISLFLSVPAFGQEALTKEESLRNPFLTQQEEVQGFTERIATVAESKNEIDEKLFVLQAVFVRGDNYTALINGEVLHVGSEMGGFTVNSINRDTVVLMNLKGKEIILKISAPQQTETYDKN